MLLGHRALAGSLSDTQSKPMHPHPTCAVNLFTAIELVEAASRRFAKVRHPGEVGVS
jgi:hypothetical protein